jgi:hypothetical protein
LVGTRLSSPLHPTSDTLIGTVRSLIRVPEGDEIRPIDVPTTGRGQLRLFTPEAVTRMVLSFEESMERLAA